MASRTGWALTDLLLVVVLVVPASATGQIPPPWTSLPVQALGTPGDNPPTTVGAFEGSIDAAVVGVPFQFGRPVVGTFSLSGLPPGATTVAAWMVVMDFWPTGSVTATFAGQNLGSAAPTYVDSGTQVPLHVWSFSVTSLVTGNGSFAFSASNTTNPYGATLVVVYSHPSLPTQRVVVNLGAEDLQHASSTTSFAGFSEAGAGRIVVFTGADDTFSDSGEGLAFNGTAIPGVTYSQNLGPYASLISRDVTVFAGTNTATVSTGGDEFGWDVAVLIGPGVTASPVPTTMGMGLAILACAIAATAVLILARRP
jgi:hypothetical protein